MALLVFFAKLLGITAAIVLLLRYVVGWLLGYRVTVPWKFEERDNKKSNDN